MRIHAFLTSLMVVGLCSGCQMEMMTLEGFCSEDPTVRGCRSEGCESAYECISYCVLYHGDGADIPEAGMGSWCDDPRVPDLGELCSEHPEVVGCHDWCADHPARCHGGGDGDADADADGDFDGDPDGDPGDADLDEDDEEPQCGDGVIDPGEDCDDGNDEDGDGCDTDCQYSCHIMEDCDDGNHCTLDSCEIFGAGLACVHEERDCVDGSPCTDDWCDPATGCRHDPIEGCCADTSDCEDGNPCTTPRCEIATGICRFDTDRAGRGCDDGLWCNGADTCDGAGGCFHSRPPCQDSVCQVCNEAADRCEVAEGMCLIDGECYEDGAANPRNECQYCDSVLSQDEWTDRPAGVACDDGLWCNGADTCDGSGLCLSTGDPCPESCLSCNEDTDGCDIVEGRCFIEGTCFADGIADPENECQRCDSVFNNEEWTPQPNYTPCSVVTVPDRSYDICSRGVCVSPGCGDATCNAPGPNWTIPDTGQVACYDDVGELVSCPGTAGAPSCGGTDFCGQDAQYGWDLTHDPAERYTRTTADQPLTTDNVTGLIWQGCPAGLSGRSCRAGTATTSTWSEALAYCDSLTWAGFSDWRLPNIYELQTLANYQDLLDRFRCWSSNTMRLNTERAHFLSVSSGETRYANKTDPHYVFCVRDELESGPVQRFVITDPDDGQPMVTDMVTGLVWQRCVAGRSGERCSGETLRMEWQDALSYCEDLELGGFTDWRLPNITELHSVIEEVCHPYFGRAVFTDRAWSSTTSVHHPTRAWIAYIIGDVIHTSEKSNMYAVRCVRSEL